LGDLYVRVIVLHFFTSTPSNADGNDGYGGGQAYFQKRFKAVITIVTITPVILLALKKFKTGKIK
jgi:hypothetical protein